MEQAQQVAIPQFLSTHPSVWEQILLCISLALTEKQSHNRIEKIREWYAISCKDWIVMEVS